MCQNSFLAPNSMCPRQTQLTITKQTSWPSTRHCGARPGPKNIQIRFDRRRCGQPFKTSWNPRPRKTAVVASAVQKRFKRGPLKGPQILQVEPGPELMASATKEIEKQNKHSTRPGDIHRDQTIVIRFNGTVAKRLFGHQYAVEIRCPRVKDLPNGSFGLPLWSPPWTAQSLAEATTEATKGRLFKNLRLFTTELSGWTKNGSPPRRWSYLYQPGELEGETKVYRIENPITKPNEPILYYLHNGHKRGFVREELLVMPTKPELTPHFEHPPFVLVRARTQLFLLIGAHHPAIHSHSSVRGGIYDPFQHVFVPVPVQFDLAFWVHLWRHF